MRVVLLGPPGAGKGTVAKILSKRWQVPHVSAGDLLRGHIAGKTALGRKASKFVDKGRLVPDGLVIEMMRERLSEEDASRGFILDGFPRTEEQARALGRLLEESGVALDGAINFEASDEKILMRLSGRRTCEKCGAIYHLKNIPPQIPGVCDECGGKLIQRNDDQEATVRERLEVYRKETLPLIQYYAGKGLLKTIPADKEIGELGPILEKLVV